MLRVPGLGKQGKQRPGLQNSAAQEQIHEIYPNTSGWYLLVYAESSKKVINSQPASGEFLRPLVTFANNLDPDEAPQKVWLHLRSKLFDIQIIYRHTKIGWKQRFFANFEEKNI